MERTSELTRKRYDRIARFYDTMDRMVPPDLRRQVLAQARGRVLEVGVGTGANLPLYPADVDLTAVDLSPRMLERARAQAKALGLAHVRLLEMDAQHLDFPDDSFDTVVTTCVFCSVPDPIAGLREIARVLRPEGQLVMLEHVRSEGAVLGPVMDILNPVVVRVFGANINRRTVENVRCSGLAVHDVRDVMGPIVKVILAGKEEGPAEDTPACASDERD